MVNKKIPIKVVPEKFFVVGIGASAGGLDAIQELFDNIPGNTGFAYVIIQHLSPDHKSLLREILSKHTSMKLFEAEDQMKVNPDCVYIIPSRKTMTIKSGHLILKDKDAHRVPNNAIDIFFESLAADQGSRSVGIILSGTGTDGTKGIESIKTNGGVILVQDPMTAAFDGMPNSAIATGQADLILPPEMMADELLDYLKETPFIKTFNTLNKEEELIIKGILELVKKETSFDFSQYKLTTLNRRLARKMFEKNITSVSEYYSFLLNNLAETHELAKEFLINVTKFFRDADAFEILNKKVVPFLFEDKKHGDEVKIWVVACSTGEEAYSMAILLYEYVEKHSYLNFSIKIFATDIDQDALNTASKGCYTQDAVKDLSEERLNKFFVKEGNMYSVIPVIRKMVVFAKHDITKDPPFSKIDLLSCRNMLIYMSAPLQKIVFKKFHFSLNENKFLFLGPSENPATLIDCFKEVDRKWKIYKCLYKSKNYEYENYLNPSKELAAVAGRAKSKNAFNNIADIFKDTLLEEYNFTGILVNKDLEIKQAVGNFKNFLKFPDDNFNLNLQKMLSADLSIAINMAARKALKEEEKISIKGVRLMEGNKQRLVNIVVKPYVEQKEYLQPFLFIIIEEVQTEKIKIKKVIPEDSISSQERIQDLEQELRDLRENLQAVIEEVESANEELQTSNEEIISSNEELQSTNEELQSLNEELHTVNAEHQMKIKELVDLNDDMNNYFNNTDIGQILIDKNLLIRKFTPAATRQVNLIETDIGRSISDISINFKGIDFLKEVRDVMDTGILQEREIVMPNQKTFLMRIMPYIKQDKTKDGVVVNFINISKIKELNSIIESLFNNAPNATIALKALRSWKGELIDFEFTAANSNAEQLLEVKGTLSNKELLKENFYLKYYFHDFIAVVQNGLKFHVEHFDKKTGKWHDLVATKMMDGVILTISDINDRKTASDLLEKSYDKLKQTSEELQQTIDKLEQSNLNLAQFASIASHDLKEPLRKIQIFGDMLKERTYEKMEPQEKEYLDKMINASNRMQTLIDNVLTFSKLSNNDIEKVASDISIIVQQILEDIEMTVKEKKAIVNLGNLPTVFAKAGQIRQLFQNLISNALKFTAKTQPVIQIREILPETEEVEHMVKDKSKYVFIEVADNGIGFDEKYSDKIFGLFQRLHGSDYSGTGLGLAICKKIIDEHEGYIKVNSKLGSGTRFLIALPK